jgi:hypothetical protein
MTQTTGAARDLFTTAATDTDAVVAGDLEFRTRTGFQWTNELVLLDGPPPWTYLASVGRSNSFFVAGRTGMMVEGYRAGPPPFDWVLRSSPLRPWLFDLAWVTNLYVAVGDQSTIMTSVDGVRWSYEFPPPSFTNTIFLGVGGTTNLLVAAGSAGALMISPHAWTDVISTNQLGTVITQQVSTLGVVWHAVEPPPTTNDLQGVCSWNGRYYVSGHQGQVLSSPDGTNWTSQTSATQSFLSGITGFSGGLIAVGDDGALVMSTNGSDWVNVPIGTTNWLYKVRWLDDRLIVVGQNGSLFTSSDGVNWQPGATGSAAWLTDATWIDNHYYAVGLNGTVLRSPDAITWTNLSTITLKSLYATAADTNHLLVAGVEGVILRSPVVPDTAPIEILAFSHTNGTNSPNWQSLFLFGGKPDQQFTLDRRSALDTNTWITGPKLEFLDASGTLFYLETVAASNAPPSEFYRATLIQ